MKISLVAVLVFTTAVFTVQAQQVTSETDQKLKSVLERFPDSDLDGDGILTQDELNKGRAQRKGRGQPERERQGNGQSQSSLPANLTVKTVAYRDGEFDRAWSLDVVYDHTDTSVRPGIVFVHGGGWKADNKKKFTQYAVEYAQKGYVCISTCYRLSHEAPFPAAVEDVKNAVRWFRAHADEYHLDPNHIGAYGNSAGAHLVCMLGLVKPEDGLEGDGTFSDYSSAVQAVAASATPTDFSLFDNLGAADSFLKGPGETLQERIKKASPINYVRADAPPFLLIHGSDDPLVKVEHADTFVQALKNAGAKDVTYIRVDGEKHGVFDNKQEENYKLMDEFFERTLKTGKE